MPNNNFFMQFLHWFKNAFDGMHQAWRTFFLLFILMSISFYFVADKAQKFYESTKKSPKEQALEEDMVSQYKDTLIQVRREKFTEKTMHDQKEIQWVLDNLEYQLNGWNNITIWKIHDHGGPLNNGEQKFMSVLYTRENIPQVDVKEVWTDRIMPQGYSEMFQKMMINKGIYMSDVSIYQDIHKGYTKENMDYWGTKAVYGIFIKTLPSGVLFISVGFKTTDPKNDDPFIGTKIDNAKEILKGLIYDVPESLKN